MPINLVLEVLGDKWSLIVIRDMIFGNRRYFRDLLHHSEEGITSSVLSERLKTLLKLQIITKANDQTHKQNMKYSLTERGIELLPVLAHMGIWGWKYLPVSAHHATGSRLLLLLQGGPKAWELFMSELRVEHLGAHRHRKSTIAAMFWQRAKLREESRSNQPRRRPKRHPELGT
jgi:DNA-binding HxlR family transcriptional regulator